MPAMHSAPFPTPKMQIFLLFWRVLWTLCLPLILIYLWNRGRRDPLYSQHLGERFGRHEPTGKPHVWIHAVSLGEMRSAVPLVRALLDRGDRVVTTHFTPAGRREARHVFASEIAAGQMQVVWVPFDRPRNLRRFFKAFHPQYGLVMEVELWPAMIATAHADGIPLLQCNGQYPTRSYERDLTKRLSRIDLVPGLAGAMVKNRVQADRLTSIGLQNVAITGELRFEQAVPETQANAAKALMQNTSRPVIAFVSVVEGEDDTFLRAMRQLKDQSTDTPLFIYVPRAPERFEPSADLLLDAGFSMQRRTELFDTDLTQNAALTADVLLGDSLGEMFFYLALADQVVVGGGFTPQGSHNIIEPLIMGKPVIVGPQIWTIEFPGAEAIAAGVCRQVDAAGLADALRTPIAPPDIDSFLDTHGGAVAKILDALPKLLNEDADT